MGTTSDASDLLFIIHFPIYPPSGKVMPEGGYLSLVDETGNFIRAFIDY
jgi:hypothetical protein